MRKKNSSHNPSYGERIAKLEANTENLVATIKDLKDNHLANINTKIDRINRMLQMRLPIWATILFSLLTSGCVGLLVLYLNAIAKI